MNVHKNVAFGLEMSGLAKNEVNHRVRESLELVGLDGYEDRDVNLLSGGEQQRVALARALAPQPALLMFDEPLGSIDRTLRERLIEDLHRILHEMKQTAIYVTHDQEEAFTIADRVVLMRAGEVEQIGTPQEIYRNPATLFAARFLGFSNILSGSTFSRDSHSYVDTSIGEFPVDPGTVGNVTILLKPDSIRLDGRGEMSLSGIITRKTFRGNLCQVDILIRNEEFTFNFLSNISLPEVGEPVTASFDPKEALILFNDEEKS
jgi:ABC-type Fe3+/spermidine/putrescine transport system ATPase subunit